MSGTSSCSNSPGRLFTEDFTGHGGDGVRHEPIAVVGMACKFPGAPDIASLWRLLERGGNAITEGEPGSGIGRIGQFYPKSAAQYPACRYAALVDDIDLFDAEFFRISPVEAQLLDPQQRMTLETCWQALEDAGIDPEGLRNTRTGVYIGISNNDYRGVSLASASQVSEPAASLYTVSGTSFNTVAGRVAYALGLEGPAIALDTACSSSLVAVHQAVSVLRQGEADLMVVGGVQAIFSGRLTQLRAQAGMLSADGQCKAFDASANGFVRGEGCGVVVLKRLTDAEEAGDPIWGVILGTAINQDGASAGLTVPSADAQVKVIDEALLQAGIAPAEVDYLEAHGTGTEVGDPIELNSAAEAYGRGRHPGRPLLVGSIKTNVGHLEPTAGVAGLMKALLAMRHGVIPKHLHFNNPNPRVNWESLPVRITNEKVDWPPLADRPPRAGISSYGWSGTNAHLIVEGFGQPAGSDEVNCDVAWPAGRQLSVAASLDSGEERIADSGEDLQERPTRLLPLSGKSEAALKDSARAYLSWLDERHEEAALGDMAWSASVGRSHFDFRDGLVFRDYTSLREGLEAVVNSAESAPSPRASKIAFVYTGQGNQWVGMGEALYRQEPVFRQALDHCERYIQAERGESLLDVMFGRPGAQGDLDEPRWTQPAIYALECALTALWRSVGVEPVAVLGHSLGEIAAAQAAGVFTLEEGLKFASARGRLMGDLPQPGAMAVVFAPEAIVEASLSDWHAAHPGSDLCIGVDNGAHQVISGPEEEVHAFADQLESAGINVRRLRPSPAYHSPLVEPALDDLQAVFDNISVSEPAVTLVSNVTGEPVAPEQLMDGGYWRQHARSPVRFRAGVETLADNLGVDTVVELGPHSILGPLVSLNWPQSAGAAETPLVLQSLLRPSIDGTEPERVDAFISAVAAAYRAGLALDFRGMFAGEERRKINIPGYPFQRRRFWVPSPQRRVSEDSHPLLGVRHESPRGEVMFETEMFPTEPDWLQDHRVYGRVLMPGALFGALACAVLQAEGTNGVAIEELQLLNPLFFSQGNGEGEASESGKRIQLIVDAAKGNQHRNFEIFSKGQGDEEWTAHAEGQLSCLDPRVEPAERAELDVVKARLAPQDVDAYYRAKAATGIDFGPSFRTLRSLWGAAGEAIGEVSLQAPGDGADSVLHPLLLDGCFQVLSAARYLSDLGGEATYLPFAWESLWLNGPMPDSLVCHARLRDVDSGLSREEGSVQPPETLTGDLWLYSSDGNALGGLTGFTLKRATRASLLSSSEGLQDLLYEVAWRERPLQERLRPAEELTAPSTIAAETGTFAEYLSTEGVKIDDRAALLRDLERLSRSYALAALEKLGWRREAGAAVDSDELRELLGIVPEHSRLLERMLRLLADAGILERRGEGSYLALLGQDDPLPDAALSDPEAFADQSIERHPHGENELGLLRRSGSALSEVLLGNVDPLSILFPREGPGAADFYFTAPASRASNRLLGDAVAAAVATWPADRRLRILEVGAGTGSGTSVVLPQLPEGNFDYVFTDISAGFFADAEERFRDSGAPIQYRALDIERDPAAQGYELHAYDLVIAVNVLHATRDLPETLGHCRDLLAPSGQVLAVESLRGRGWQDMTFGQLDGWWRFSDAYRPEHAIASPQTWRLALADAGFSDPVVLGGESRSDVEGPLGSGVIMARGPAAVAWPAGAWVLVGVGDNTLPLLATGLAAQNQTAVIAIPETASPSVSRVPGVLQVPVEATDRASWRSLLEELPEEMPLQGVVHCSSLSGSGVSGQTGELAEDAADAGASALALVQALQDCDLVPAKGLWFITRGAQVLEQDYKREAADQLSGSTLWGFGKAVAREAGYLQPRMIDLDPAQAQPAEDLVNELMFPDRETHIAWRSGSRLAARLLKSGEGRTRIPLPEDTNWRLASTPGEGLEGLHAEPATSRALASGEIRVAVEAAGLNFSDVLISVGAVEMEPMLGDEYCGRVIEVAPDVAGFQVGDRVLGLGIGTFRPQLVTLAEMAAHAPEGIPSAALATIPTSFVSAELGFQMSGLKAGDRVLVHTASGGVGLAAIQLVQAAGAEVIATASAPKQAYLRSLGINHVFDSRTSDFGPQVMAATGGQGVDVVLNSLTGPGFIEASLSCLASGGRFVEMGRRDIWTAEQVASVRPDVSYSVLEVDALKRRDPATPGASLRRVMARVSAGELTALTSTRWPMAEIIPAMEFMRSARHIGKNVIVMPHLPDGRLRSDRTYLVTGGLGGIGTLIAGWLAERGAGAIVLNGRRPPDPEAQEVIESLRRQGADVRVELADMTDPSAINQMLGRIDAQMPPLAGVIHSVGVLSDGSLGNQTWERFEQVLWPKMLGAWQLHQSTLDRDLDLFVLFSSITGVVGNSGQGNHAAANAFLDQLAAYRRSLGLPGQSIAWGAWSGLGEAEEQRERIERQLEASGTGWISPQQGLNAFEELLRRDLNFGMVASVDWPALAANFEEPPPFLEELLPREDESDTSDSIETTDLLSQLKEKPVEAWEQTLVSFLQRELQAVLRLPSLPAPAMGFFDLGMDSLMSVELRNRLNRALSGEFVVSNTAVFDYPNIIALANHLGQGLEETLPYEESETELAPVPLQAERTTPVDGEVIAIVGMACRFPGAPDLESFWELLTDGRHAVTDGRPLEGPWEGLPGNPKAEEAIFRRGGFIEDLDRFDNRFFNISPLEARMMDPQQRLLLETTWHALEDAGLNPQSLRGSRTGVYAGIGASEYRDVIAAHGQDDLYFGTSGSLTAGRIAFVLGLEGPAMPVDMACASSLAAVHHAVVSLQRGEVDMALAGGVNTTLSLPMARFHRDMGMLSLSGRCNAFDARADGFVRSEGCGVLVLKRLSQAEADGDRIWALVRGTAVNQSGASAALPVPNGPAQERVMEEALSMAGTAPADVDYLEAHGTGTELGDSIELRALASVYGQGRDTDRPLLLGSVKTNIGHTEWASGMASIIKNVLAMQRGVIPAHLHFADPNPNFDWEQLPVRITSEKLGWPAVSDRNPLSAINAFGLSGTNAHVVLEGWRSSTDAATAAEEPAWPIGETQLAPVPLPRWYGEVREFTGRTQPRVTRILPLSGKSAESLRELAAAYLSWLDRADIERESTDDCGGILADLAWTAGTGRSHFLHRAAVVFHDVCSLRSGLEDILARSDSTVKRSQATGPGIAFVYSGTGGLWTGEVGELYRTEPVFRAILDRCDELLGQAQAEPLLDLLNSNGGTVDSLLQPGQANLAALAVEVGLTALWESVGIRPVAVMGIGTGEIAAAHTAGALALDDGLRLAAALTAAEAALPIVPVAAPTIPLVSSVTGRPVHDLRELDNSHWRRLTAGGGVFQNGVQSLADTGASLVVALGNAEGFDEESPDSRIPIVLCLPTSHAETAGGSDGFLRAMAAAYEAGAPVNFGGYLPGRRGGESLYRCIPSNAGVSGCRSGEEQGKRMSTSHLGVHRD